jgi:pectinesterase
MIVALIGDSTVMDEGGWGKAFAARFKPGVRVLNFAMGGRSSKSFFTENRLPAVLEAKPDYMLIQFGHNDQPGKGAERETDPAGAFREYLRLYVDQARAIGAAPILVSSLTRRTFGGDGRIQSTLAPWAEAAGAVAGELGVPFIDLHAASVALHDAIGPEASREFNLTPEDPTHLNAGGAKAIADLVVRGLRSAAPGLADQLL